MRSAVQVLIAAVMCGVLAGAAWWAMLPAPRPAHVPKAVIMPMADAPELPSDKEWAARQADKDPVAMEIDRPDPTAVERSVYYPGCDEVRAAGKAPLRIGEPGYRPELDGDGDGIACEPKPAAN